MFLIQILVMLRVYAMNGNLNNINGELCLIIINFDLNNNATVTWNIENGATQYDLDIYHVKSAIHTLQSDTMQVNGLNMVYQNGKFPLVTGIGGIGTNVTLEPATIAFVILVPK